MFKPSVTVAEVVALLNELTAMDPAAMHALVESRVACNESIADHPTVQVCVPGNEGGSTYEFGVLGLLNGLFGTDDLSYGAISASFEEGRLVRFNERSPLHDGDGNKGCAGGEVS